MAVIANARASVILDNMVISPHVEAGIGFRELDRGARRLFPRSHSNGVRQLQVFVYSGTCADHIGVIRLRNRTSRAILVAMFSPHRLLAKLTGQASNCYRWPQSDGSGSLGQATVSKSITEL